MNKMHSTETEPLRANNEHEHGHEGREVGEEIITRQKQRTCCTTKSKIGWGIGISLFLILSGLMVYFFFPRYPKVGFYRVDLDDAKPVGSHKILGGLSEKNNTVNLGLVMQVYANSTLFFDLEVKDIQVEGYMKLDNGDYIPVGKGHLKHPIVIPKRTNFYKFEMPFMLTYDTTKSSKKSSDAFKQFLDKCGIDGKPKRDIKIKYIARAWIPLLSWTGYVPKFVKEIQFACPFNMDFLSGVRKAFGFLF